MEKAAHSVRPDPLYVDAAYDADWVHAHRGGWGVMG